MIHMYESICAKGLDISLEEAKKIIYACCTTSHGFQAIMTEQESEIFMEFSEVCHILPDSYSDPVNKEFGGDKYENGVITHRPLPPELEKIFDMRVGLSRLLPRTEPGCSRKMVLKDEPFQ